MSDDPRFAHYDKAYYVGRACPESQSYDRRILRPGDMGAALCYAFGVDSYDAACAVLGACADRPRQLTNTTLDVQLDAISRAATRQPSHILEVGCGRGEIAAACWRLGVPYAGVEPSAAAIEIAIQTRSQWTVSRHHTTIASEAPIVSHWLSPSRGDNLLINQSLGEYAAGLSPVGGFPHDTVLFVESIEHIPQGEFDAAWPVLRERLRRTSGRLIIVNWIDYHPIVPDGTGWDHVRLVDDAFYDSLARDAARTVFRQGSHLVLEF